MPTELMPNDFLPNGLPPVIRGNILNLKSLVKTYVTKAPIITFAI